MNPRFEVWDAFIAVHQLGLDASRAGYREGAAHFLRVTRHPIHPLWDNLTATFEALERFLREVEAAGETKLVVDARKAATLVVAEIDQADIDLNEIAELFDIRTVDDAFVDSTPYWDNAWEYTRDQQREIRAQGEEEGLSEEGIEQKIQDMVDTAASEREAEDHRQYINALLEAVEPEFEEAGLKLVQVRADSNWNWRIEPQTYWVTAVEKIVNTINGYGEFAFDSGEELLLSGPYSPRQAVLEHLHYLNHRAEVYRDTSARSRFERRLR